MLIIQIVTIMIKRLKELPSLPKKQRKNIQQSVLEVARIEEVTQNRGLTLSSIDVLSNDETPEDLGLGTSLSIHIREDTFISFVQRNITGTFSWTPGTPPPSLRKVNQQNEP